MVYFRKLVQDKLYAILIEQQVISLSCPNWETIRYIPNSLNTVSIWVWQGGGLILNLQSYVSVFLKKKKKEKKTLCILLIPWIYFLKALRKPL